MRQAWIWCVALVCGAWLGTAQAEVKLPNVFSDHALLQRGIQVPVWGTAEAGEKITVQFAGQTKTATAGQDGKWRVTLDPLKPGGPYVMTVSGMNTLTREDILVGDVWLCAGQSNMGTGMGGAQWWMSQCPGANIPGMRFLIMGREGGHSAAEPQDDVPEQWYPCTPANSMGMSAVGFFFGRQLHQELGVPIGLIKCSSWGVAAEQYVSLEALRQTELFKPLVDTLEASMADYQKKKAEREQAYETQLKAYEDKMAEFEKALAANDPGLKEHWEDPATDVSKWGSIRMPGGWENTELKGQAGSVWLRKDTSVVASWVSKELRIQLGGCDDTATVYFNGKEVGRTSPEADILGYRVPVGLAKAGGNTVVVRVVDFGGSPGRLGSMEFLMYLAPADGGNGDERMPMPGDWRYKAGYTIPRDSLSLARPSPPASPAAGGIGSLYNGMVAPIVGYGIKGVLWYQGENNAERAKEYETLFPLLINSWRKAWGQPPSQSSGAPGDFAFLWVQLPNFLGCGKPKDYVEPGPAAQPGDLPVGWAAVRDAQRKTLAVPNTAMAVTIDIGETWDIHPNNKKTVADRLVLAALGSFYGKKVESSGPLYDSMKVDGNKIRLRFKHVADGLVAQGGGPLKQFAIAGEDKVFYWADAQIKGNTVIAGSDKVKTPVAVRYAFSGAPEGANLFNAAGLPASPFRTDDWDLRSADDKKK